WLAQGQYRQLRGRIIRDGRLCADLGDRDSHCGSSAAQAGRAHGAGGSGGGASRGPLGGPGGGSCLLSAGLSSPPPAGSGASETSRRDQAESAYEVKTVVQWTSSQDRI